MQHWWLNTQCWRPKQTRWLSLLNCNKKPNPKGAQHMVEIGLWVSENSWCYQKANLRNRTSSNYYRELKLWNWILKNVMLMKPKRLTVHQIWNRGYNFMSAVCFVLIWCFLCDKSFLCVWSFFDFLSFSPSLIFNTLLTTLHNLFSCSVSASSSLSTAAWKFP